jgi:hypothetical protein
MDQLIIMSLLIISTIAILVYPLWQDNLPAFLIMVTILTISIIYVVTHKDNIMEQFQISGEAIQNVGSIYNSSQMTVGNLTTTNDLKVSGLIRSGGTNVILGGSQNKNRWLLHTPDDDRKGFWVAPGNGTDNWDWGKSATFYSNGAFGIGNGWTFDATDGHLRFKYNGDQKFIIHNDGKAWSANEGWFENKVNYDQNISIHGHSGLLDNYRQRCNNGDKDRDIGVACQEGIGQGWEKWRIRRR